MDSKVDKEQFQQYLLEARTWETDKVQALTRSKRTAWIVASASGVLAFLSVLAVMALTPLKSVEPYVIRVDNSTGVVDVVQSIKDGKTNYEESINKFFVQWYVRYREGYSKDLAEEYYYNVGLMSVGAEQQRYLDYFNPKNSQSPLNIYGDYARLKIRVKSTSFIKPDVALVRYIREVERGNDKPQSTHWAATVTFKYATSPMSEKDRGINPLGFQVIEYRNDPDAVIQDATSPRSAVQPLPTPYNGVSVFPNPVPSASLTQPNTQ